MWITYDLQTIRKPFHSMLNVLRGNVAMKQRTNKNNLKTECTKRFINRKVGNILTTM